MSIWKDGMATATDDSAELVERLRHDLSWHYGEVDRLRTVMRRAVNILTGPRWPGDDDPYIATLRLLEEALKPNSTVGH